MSDKQENIDYLAELVVSQLVANQNISDANVYIHLLGVFRRFFSKDVEKIDVHKNEKGEKEWDIYVHREGLYDLLPEGLFHSHTQKYFKDRRETIQEFTLHDDEEKIARKFFMPLEQEFFKHLVNKESFEQNFFYAPETIREFIDFFNLDHLGLNMYQQASLFFILPHVPKIVGNLGLTETCFEIILQEQVKFKMAYKPSAIKPADEIPVLNRSKLGVNSLLGNHCIDHNPQLLLKVGPLQESNSLIHFLSGINLQLINRLIELFIQADLVTQMNVLLNEQDEAFIMGENEYEGRLNYSTTI